MESKEPIASEDTAISYDWLNEALCGGGSLLAYLQSFAAQAGTALQPTLKSVVSVYHLYVEEQPTGTVAVAACILLGTISLLYAACKRVGRQKVATPQEDCELRPTNLTCGWSIYDLAKTAYEPGHTEAVINILEKLNYDVNSEIPSNGLTIFLCACLSGKRELINYMMAKGADVHRTTRAGDTALYLATFGILSSPRPDLRVLEDLIKAGCNVNRANVSGYTSLHRAAGQGSLKVIQTLLDHGADPYQKSMSGIYPMDSAINAGNLDAAALLKISIPNPHVWDVVEPHTPPSIRLGLQSPHRKHLIESSRRVTSPHIL